MGIVVLGAVFVDIKGYPLSTYIPAGRNAGRIETVHGGVSRNVVEDIANVELRPTFVSLVDKSGSGQDVIDKLNRHKVDTRYMRKTEDGMGTWLAVFDHEGDVVGSISRRPNLRPIADILDEQGDEIFADCDGICLELDMDQEAVKRVFHYAEKYNKKVFAVISNINIAMERRDFLKRVDCFICNKQEAGILFSENYDETPTEEMVKIVKEKAEKAQIRRLIVTLGGDGAVYTELNGESGYAPAKQVHVIDTTGAGDSFFAGVSIGVTYGKTLGEACEIGARLAASVIGTKDNVCPRFMPAEFGLEV